MTHTTSSNPRSVLHALQPLGLGSDQAESLLSYFCRLATSHCTSTLELSRKMLGFMGSEPTVKYAWYDRQISGLGEGALTYTAALAATTTVSDLHLHTFLPWQKVIAGNGLPLHKAGQFCPQCLYEDRHTAQTPYLRLCWEPALVTVCHRHQVPLQQCCPHCQHTNVRHTRAFTVVGWCGNCGKFMGVESAPQEMDELALWQAQQVALLVGLQQSSALDLETDSVLEGVAHVIERTCDGKYAALARHLGIAKSTIHTWLRDRRTPTVDMTLRVARFAQIDLAALLTGQTDTWTLPQTSPQLSLALDYPERPKWNRRVHTHDWDHIEQQLQSILRQPMPVSVMHAASVVRVPSRMLYMNCNTTARKIAHRWLQYLKRRQQSHVVAAWPYIETASRQLLDAGMSPSMREIEKMVPAQILNRVCNCWDVLRQVREHIESSEHATANLCEHNYPQKFVPETL